MERYSRQTRLSEIGPSGQKIVQQKIVAIVGLGALGTVAAELLIRAGVKKIILIDGDKVEESNLSRQLYTERDIGKNKVLAAKEKLHQINSQAIITAHPTHLHRQNLSLLHADLFLDCTDNLPTRLLFNDYAKRQKIPWIYGAAIRTSGYVMLMLPQGPCLQCFLANTPTETCQTVGVLNSATTVIAALQVSLALQFLLEKKLNPALIYVDVWQPVLKKLHLKQNPTCPACHGKFIYLQQLEPDLIPFCGKYLLIGRKQNLSKVKKQWQKVGKVMDNGSSLHFKDITLYQDGRALIKAASSQHARRIYSKLIR